MPDPENKRSTPQATRRLAWKLGVLAAAMFGFGFVLVPLYDVFCEAAGIKGKTGQITEMAARDVAVDRGRFVTVEFLGTINGSLPWDFRPIRTRLRVHPGEVHEVRYFAHNTSARNTTGVAVPNLIPAASSPHFKKIECFCFRQQALAPGEAREMPVRFMVDPALPAGVTELSLSYTFFEAGKQQSG
jgi:cytochrome c oxidase assembly protein subunit 11